MRRTLLAVGFAVLTSMMLIPRGHVDILRYGHAKEGEILEFLPFFSQSGVPQNEIMWQTFILETLFLVILAAVIVNFPRRQKRERDQTHL